MAGSCCGKGRRSCSVLPKCIFPKEKRAVRQRETVVLALEKHRCCERDAGRAMRAAGQCCGVHHLAFDFNTGALTVVGKLLDPRQLQQRVRAATCGNVDVLYPAPPGNAPEGHDNRGGCWGDRGNCVVGQAGMLCDRPVERPCWGVPPPCAPPVPPCAPVGCSPHHHGYYCHGLF